MEQYQPDPMRYYDENLYPPQFNRTEHYYHNHPYPHYYQPDIQSVDPRYEESRIIHGTRSFQAPQIRFESPHETLDRYKHVKPEYTRKQEFENFAQVPILDINEAPPHEHFTLSQGVPGNYIENTKKQYIEDQYAQDLQWQLKFGPKTKEKRSKIEIQKYYNNIKVSYDPRGFISIDNIKENYSEKPSQQPIQQNYSNHDYTHTPLQQQVTLGQLPPQHQHENPYTYNHQIPQKTSSDENTAKIGSKLFTNNNESIVVDKIDV